jgi:hypothetical protein
MFPGKSVARRAGSLEKDTNISGRYSTTLQGCCFSAAGSKRAVVEQEERRAAADSLKMNRIPRLGELDTSSKEFDELQAETCRMLILKLIGTFFFKRSSKHRISLPSQ